MLLQDNKQNIYLRKLNGLGEKITVLNSLTIKQLKNIVHSFKNLEVNQVNQVKQIDFDLFFKGKNIADKEQSTLRQLNIPSEGIIHIVFKQQKLNNKIECKGINDKTNFLIQQSKIIDLRIMFNDQEHKFQVHSDILVLQFKKIMAKKLNLIFQTLILSHFGCQMMNEKSLKFYNLKNYTLLSLKFNLQKFDKKKLQSRMVSSVTFSDQNNQPNSNQPFIQQFQNKQLVSSKSIDSQKDQNESSLKNSSNLAKNMYKSDINGLSNNTGTSKAALMFKNALHQKIIQTQSIVSGSFSQDTVGLGNDPNSLMITIKNQQETKQFLFQCNKNHQMINIRQKLLEIQNINIDCKDKLEISMEEDLFQSIDLNKSGSLNLHQIIKKMGKQRAVFIYRLIK